MVVVRRLDAGVGPTDIDVIRRAAPTARCPPGPPNRSPARRNDDENDESGLNYDKQEHCTDTGIVMRGHGEESPQTDEEMVTTSFVERVFAMSDVGMRWSG